MTKTEPTANRTQSIYDELWPLIDRAQKGDRTTLPAIKELLKDPAVVDECGGDLAKQTQINIINKFCGQNLLARESLIRKLDLLRAAAVQRDAREPVGSKYSAERKLWNSINFCPRFLR